MPYNFLNNPLQMKCFVFLFTGLSCLTNISQAKDLNAYMLQLSNQKIQPGLLELETHTAEFKKRTIDFCASQNEQTFLALKAHWKSAYLSWKKIQLFGFGSTGSLRVERHLDFWPTRVSKITHLLTATDVEKAFQVSGVSVRGFPAIEWLIYNSDLKKSQKFCQLLSLMSQDVLNQTQSLKQAWQNDLIELNASSGAELKTFVYSNKPAEELVNALVVGIYAIRKKSLITPMGLTTGLIDVKRMEAYNSQLSSLTLQTRLHSIIELFEDKHTGLINWLETNEQHNLALRFREKIETIKLFFPLIDDDFENLIQLKDKQLIELESHINDLQFLIEEDLSTHFNLIMFFKDLDGD